MQKEILSAYKNAKHCLDLFAGCGTLSANLLTQKVKITAIDTQIECLKAYEAGYKNFKQDNLLKVEIRDLINAPVMSSFLNYFDGIILDPREVVQMNKLSKFLCLIVRQLPMFPATP